MLRNRIAAAANILITIRSETYRVDSRSVPPGNIARRSCSWIRGRELVPRAARISLATKPRRDRSRSRPGGISGNGHVDRTWVSFMKVARRSPRCRQLCVGLGVRRCPSVSAAADSGRLWRATAADSPSPRHGRFRRGVSPDFERGASPSRQYCITIGKSS